MKKNNIRKNAAVNACITALYIALIALFLSSTPHIFNETGTKNPFIPIAMLLLLVFSVAFVGTFIFGKPIMWYLEGKKKEALGLLGYTLVFLFVLTGLAFVVLYMVL